jgi:hypothetical protein
MIGRLLTAKQLSPALLDGLLVQPLPPPEEFVVS